MDLVLVFHEAKLFHSRYFALEWKSSLTCKKRKNKTINFLLIFLVSTTICTRRSEISLILSYVLLGFKWIFDGCDLTEETTNVCCLWWTYNSRHSNMNRNEYYQTLVLYFFYENDFLIKRTQTHIHSHMKTHIHFSNILTIPGRF